MKQKGFLLAAWLGFSIALSGYASNYKHVNGQENFYYGHVSYAEIKNDGQDPLVFREGRLVPETAVLNLPLGPGDAIQTSGERRLEIQFDTGTIVRLDLNTRLKIETLLAQCLSTTRKISNLVLEGGQVYVMYKRYSYQEIFQVVTSGAAVKLDHSSVAMVRLTEKGDTAVQVERGKAFLLYGSDERDLSQKRVNSRQRGIVSAENKVELAEYEAVSDFKAWNESINDQFQELHTESYLPKPVRNLPKAVFEFAQKFGNMYGEWLWHDLYGYVWRPYLNDHRYPWGTWQPFINGSWTSYGGEMFWVPSEPWGWVPYHLGIWMWDKNKGWVWLPGSMFAPAWAVWDFYAGMLCWRPFYLYDWMYGVDAVWGMSYWGGFYGSYGLSDSNPLNPQSSKNVISSIRKDQLKKKDEPSFPMPREMKKALGVTLAALKSGDQALWSSVEGLPRHSIFIKKQDLLAPKWQEKIVPLDRLAREFMASPQAFEVASARPSADVSRDARLTIERSHVMADLRARTVPSPGLPRQIEPAAKTLAFRFRDWNPDVKTAIRLGMEISYSSRTNEVACPQLGLSSRQINPAAQAIESHGGFMSPGDASSSSGHASARGSASRPAGQPRTSDSSGGKKKN